MPNNRQQEYFYANRSYRPISHFIVNFVYISVVSFLRQLLESIWKFSSSFNSPMANWTIWSIWIKKFMLTIIRHLIKHWQSFFYFFKTKENICLLVRLITSERTYRDKHYCHLPKIIISIHLILRSFYSSLIRFISHLKNIIILRILHFTFSHFLFSLPLRQPKTNSVNNSRKFI